MIIKLVFFRLIDSLFWLHHSLTLINSSFTKDSNSIILVEEANIFVSSAKSLKDSLFEQFDMSLMYKRNSIGPKELPC